MQDPNHVNRPRDPVNEPIDPLTGAPAERQTIINNGSGRSSGTGGWAVAVIIAVIVAVGAIYFVGSGTPGDGVDPNANTSSIEQPEQAPATGDQPAETQPLEAQPDAGQPADGATAQ